MSETYREINKGQNTITIDVSSLATGVYSLRVATPEEEHIEKEFIKK